MRWTHAPDRAENKAMDFQPTIVTAACFAFLLAGFIKGIVGFGLPTVGIGLLGLFMTPLEAALILVVPTLVTNVWQLAAGPNLKPLLRRLGSMLLATAVVTYATAGLLARDTTGRATTALGAALIVYAVIGLAAVQLCVPRRAEPWLSPIMGGLTGLVAGATGVFSIPGIPYMQALGLDKEDLVQALGLSFTVSMVALAAGLAREGAFHASLSASSRSSRSVPRSPACIWGNGCGCACARRCFNSASSSACWRSALTWCCDR